VPYNQWYNRKKDDFWVIFWVKQQNVAPALKASSSLLNFGRGDVKGL
jgi:hypothetical protein